MINRGDGIANDEDEDNDKDDADNFWTWVTMCGNEEETLSGWRCGEGFRKALWQIIAVC